ncbi:MAG: hypothetical protein LAT83_23130 [Kiritimatiellae bacterium]|nr:hypothetical protein [Kiritimatiellia bacterium]
MLLIMVLTFVAMVRSGLRDVVNHQHTLQAQANARLGADLAIGRLQELMGPDTRVSASAELFGGPESNLSGMPAPSAAHPRWVGVWDAAEFDDSQPANKPFLDWLISRGNGDNVPLLGPGSVEDSSDQVGTGITRFGDQGLAWFVEDHGLRAQLRPRFRNDHPGGSWRPGAGLIPGAVPPEAFPGLGSLAGVGLDDFFRLFSLRELPFLVPEAQREEAASIAATRRFDYTLLSRGVLSNTRHGGLRKDLTLAFENDAVFERVFPHRSLPVDPDRAEHFLIEADKLAQAQDLRENGYIHWGIFKDYYNLKRHIEVRNGLPVLYQAGLDWRDINQNQSQPPASPLGRGTLGPHQMGPNRNQSTYHGQRPFGQPDPIEQTPESRPYMHNPVNTTYSYMQVNGWIEYHPATADDPAGFRTHAQLITGLYNPYNINIRIRGHQNGGVKFMNWPQIFLNFPGLTTANPGEEGFGGQLLRIGSGLQPEIVPPGLSRAYSIRDYADRDAGQAYHGDAEFGNEIAHLVSESFVSELIPWDGDPNHPVNASMWVSQDGRPVMSLGNEDPRWSAHRHDWEINQVFYEPFRWDIHNQTGSKLLQNTISPNESENAPFTFAMRLRTTRETPANQALRPLIDANIRARWNNPRWDSPLNLPHLAVFSPEMEPDDLVPQMNVEDSPLGHLYQGAGHDPLFGNTRVILFDVPREDLVSLGQLQHASAGRFSYEPSYIAGNSYANPRIPLNRWRASVSDTYSSGLRYSINGNFNLYDASYLVNQRMWDGHVFTTIPQVRDNFTPGEPQIDYARLLAGEDLLPNPRFLPYEPRGSAFTAEVLRDEGNDADSGGFHHNAGHLLVDGAFNVNSTSVNAWEAFLSGTLGLPVQQVNENGVITGFRSPGDGNVRFPRIQAPLGDGMLRDSPDENYWTGFRELTPGEVNQLATAIVAQVKRRGPFLGMGEFVNRMLRDGPEGHAGALQAALDATVNQNIDSDYEFPAGVASGDSTQGAGFPGQLLQGDLLQALGPMMTARSDTFTVRAYGETGPSGAPLSRAWCEVVVQRVPDPVQSAGEMSGDDLLRELANPSSPFGRQFRVLSFRWLNEDEI